MYEFFLIQTPFFFSRHILWWKGCFVLPCLDCLLSQKHFTDKILVHQLCGTINLYFVLQNKMKLQSRWRIFVIWIFNKVHWSFSWAMLEVLKGSFSIKFQICFIIVIWINLQEDWFSNKVKNIGFLHLNFYPIYHYIYLPILVSHCQARVVLNTPENSSYFISTVYPAQK